MPTNIYQKGLQFFIEAEEHGGSNGAVISSVNDLSVYNRDLAAASNQPTVKTGAVNGKRSFNWDGTKNPLVYEGNFTIRCGFLVVKVNGNFTGSYQGILSSPATHGILTGIGGTNLFYDFLYEYYEYRLNDHIYPVTFDHLGNRSFTAPAPVSSFGIIYFKFWQNITLDGIQLGQDRGFTDRKFNGEIALLALYNRDFCEFEIRNNIQSIANSYQLALPDVFPFQGQKGDPITVSKRVISDGQDEPVTRIKRSARQSFELSFIDRHQKERIRANAFWDEFHPNKRFYYRDYQTIAPVDTLVRFPENSQFQWKGGITINNNSYGFQVVESIVPPSTSVPGAPAIPVESEDIAPAGDTTVPSVPTMDSVEDIESTSMAVNWLASTDNVAVTGYKLQRATNSGFTTGVTETDAGNVLTAAVTGLSPSTTYYFRVRAYDAAGNHSGYSSSLNATTGAASSGIALVANVSKAGSPSGGTSDPIDTTGASLLVVAVAHHQGPAATVTDSKGNTWQSLTKYSNSGDVSIQFFYCKNPSSVGSNHTFTVSGTTIYSGFAVGAWSGTNTSANADGENGSTGSGATLQPGSLTPSVNNCLVVTAIGHKVTSLSVGSGFSPIEQEAFVGGNSYGVGLAYKVQTTATAENPTWTPDSAAAAAAAIAAFRPV